MQDKISKNYFFKLTNDGNDYKCYLQDNIIKYQKKKKKDYLYMLIEKPNN